MQTHRLPDSGVNDVISGRGGNYVLTGGGGRDVFLFNTLDGTVDQITDFSGDLIFVDGNVFCNVTYSAGTLLNNGAAFAKLVGSPAFDINDDLYMY